MRRVTLLTIVFTVVLMLNSFAQKGFVNPAAKYCEILGYKYQITSVKGLGEVGMALLPDGRLVNAWDFYKGKVAQEYSYAAKYGYTVITEISKENGFTMESPVCVRMVKGIQEKIPLVELMEKNGDYLYTEKPGMIDYHDFAQVDPNFPVIDVVPTSFDWRSYNGHSYIGAPRDQGNCGSCYAFGATACAEGTYNFATGKYDGNTSDFAESYIVWCLSQLAAYSGHFGGCSGADYDYQELQALVDVGAIPESYFPYTDVDGQTCPSSTSSAPKTKFLGWYRVACSDVTAIKTAIMTYGVVDAAVNVTTNFQNYSGGVFTDTQTSCTGSPCYNTTTNHAISLVGWGTDATYGDYWILRNSWGGSWGESGYMKLSVSSARILCSVCYMTYQATTPTAPTAATVAASGVSTSGATLNGTVNNNNAASTTVTFEYGTTTSYGSTVSATPSSVTGSTSTSVTATLTGLTANTTYHFRVKAVNSVGTTYGSDMTFITTNIVTLPLPVTENFAASTMPSGWTTVNTGTGITERWSVSNTANAGGTAYEMKCSYQNINPATTMLVTPALSTSGLSTIILNAKYMLDDYGAGATIKVQTSTNKTTWTDVSGWSLTTVSNTNRSGSITNLSIPVSGATTYVAFVITGNLYQIDYFYLDNVSITAPSTPTAPSATTVAATSVTNTGAALNGTVNNNNAASTTVTFEYGTTTSYGTSVTATPSSVTGSANTTVTASITGLTANTLYHYRVKAVNSVGTTYGSDLTFTTTGVLYCATKGTNCSEEWIAKVQLGSFTKTSTGTSYSDFTSSVITVVAGSNSLTLTPGFSGSSYTEYFRVWIDFNKDGDFVDTGEQVYAPAGSKTAVTGTITIPTTFSGTTRMRVSMKYGSAPTSCETFSYGEVEDYTISLNKSFSMQENNMTFNIYPNPANDMVYIASNELGVEMKIFNSMGELVDFKIITDNTQSLNISSYPNGVYLVYIINKNSVAKTAKFIKQ